MIGFLKGDHSSYVDVEFPVRVLKQAFSQS